MLRTKNLPQTEDKDIRITQITKKYGSPKSTRNRLNDYIRNEFVRQQLISKYGVIQSIRINKYMRQC